MTTNHCGTCTACCRVFNIPEMNKPAGKWCDHCNVGKGCRIYDTRPERCAEYQCMWLQSQTRPEPGAAMPVALRPDKCGVVISATTNPMILGATCLPDRPDAWKRGEAFKLIQFLVAKGVTVAVGIPGGPEQLVLDKSGARKVKMTAPDKDGMQWSEDFAMQPDSVDTSAN